MDIHWWTYFIPPVWLAGFVDLFSGRAVSSENAILALTALFVSIAGASFMIKYLSSGFVDVLSEGAVETDISGKGKRAVKEQNGIQPGPDFLYIRCRTNGLETYHGNHKTRP